MITKSPCARFISLITPKIRESPRAMRAYNPPSMMPIKTGVMMSPEPVISGTLLNSEIGPFHLIFLSELSGGSAQGIPAGFEYVGPVSLLKRSFYVLFYKEDGNTPFLDLLKCSEYFIDHDRGKTEGHFIDQH